MKYQTISRFMIASSIALGISLPVIASTAGSHDGDCKNRLERHHETGEFWMGHFPPYLKNLNLTDEQRGKIKSLMHDQESAMHNKMQELRKAHMELRSLSMSADYDEAKVKMLSESSAKVMAEMAQMRAHTENQIYQLLSPEQRKQLEEQKMRYKSRSQEKDGAH